MYIYVCVRVCVCMCMYVFINLCVHLERSQRSPRSSFRYELINRQIDRYRDHLYTYIYVCVRVCVCMYVFINLCVHLERSQRAQRSSSRCELYIVRSIDRGYICSCVCVCKKITGHTHKHTTKTTQHTTRQKQHNNNTRHDKNNTTNDHTKIHPPPALNNDRR